VAWQTEKTTGIHGRLVEAWLLGVGVGFFFLRESALAFAGSMLAGLGLGLMTTSILSNRNQQE
jgi:hypothetical protein